MAVVVVVLIVAVVGGIAYLSYQARKKRVAAVVALGKRIGFTFSADDIEGVVSMPFGLFRRGDGRKVELVLSGTHNGLPMKLFDYWYYDTTTDSQGHTSRSYHRYTCAILTIPAACPRCTLGHEGLFSRIGEHLGVHDVQFESDEFNKRYRVKCDDQKFAFSLVDGQMMQYLLAAGDFDSVEIVGPWVLLVTPKRDPSTWLDLGAWLEQFHAHVPSVVYSQFPPT